MIDRSTMREEWQRMLSFAPPSVREAIPLRLWDRDRLYALDLPVRDVPVGNLLWMLDIPLWAVDGVPFQVSPNKVAVDPGRYADQYRRTLNADLSWPIHVMRHNGRWTILDGVHRLLKAKMEHRAAIAAKILSPEDYESILIL